MGVRARALRGPARRRRAGMVYPPALWAGLSCPGPVGRDLVHPGDGGDGGDRLLDLSQLIGVKRW